MEICPDCEGRKIISGIGCGANGCKPMTLPCFTCKGIGSISEEQVERIRKGEAMRQDRLARDMSLREEAQRLGIKARELSDLEHGKTP
jgi:hypothetical protein